MSFLTKIFGSRNQRLLKQYQKIVREINALEPKYETLSDDQLKAKTPEFKERLAKGATLDSLLPEAFAVGGRRAVEGGERGEADPFAGGLESGGRATTVDALLLPVVTFAGLAVAATFRGEGAVPLAGPAAGGAGTAEPRAFVVDDPDTIVT